MAEGVRDGRHWISAPCLDQLRDEVNERWPDRPKGIDGSIGDDDHAARRSWHNPADDGQLPDIVDARDFTHSAEWNSYEFSRWLAKTGDYRLAAIGSYDPVKKSEMWWSSRHDQSVNDGWVYQNLRGASHEGHAHVECTHTHEARYDKRPWGVNQEEPLKLDNEDWAKMSGLIDDRINEALAMTVDGKRKPGEMKFGIARAIRFVDALDAAGITRVVAFVDKISAAVKKALKVT